MKLNAEEMKEIEMCDVTSKALKKKVRPYTNKKGNSSGGNSSNNRSNQSSDSSSFGLGSLLVMTLALGAGAFYTVNNCCNMEWCRSIDIAKELLHC